MQMQLDAPGLAAGFQQPGVGRAAALTDPEMRGDAAFGFGVACQTTRPCMPLVTT